MSKQLLLTVLDYTIWANRQLLDACAALTEEQLNRDLGASHRSVLETLRHLFFAERSWSYRLRIDALPPMIQMADPKFDPNPPLESGFLTLTEAWPAVWISAREWLEKLSDEDLNHELVSLMPDGSNFMISRWKILLHMINHATLHRGQIMNMLRTLGKQPPGTDIFNFYLLKPNT